ncbi:CHAT domain-containing protein [Marivirga sp. S37H4]|uniref:CHAT domain-containing protein n=1 Tax=Marivirga aurantiaca TaxID=2802615 RepID=A0A934X058_9BACT|nr:CHAT domain-containing tetratricopeptide repeat protein [Marivirga aurantiaca]MBK6266444.1 CHAT domain-containing protein [Marivirga aurantiaca]
MKTFRFILLHFTALFTLHSHTGFAQDNFNFSTIDQHFNNGQFEKVIANRAEILNYVQKGQDSLSAEMLYFLGDAYLALDRTEDGLLIMEEELKLRKKLSNNDPSLIANLQFNLGYYYSVLNRFPKSILYYENAIESFRSIEGTASAAYVEGNIELAKVLSISGKSAPALKTLNELRKNDFARENYLHVIRKEIGMVYLDRGNYYRSEEILTQNLKLLLDLFGKESIQYAEGLVALATPKFYKSNYAEAEKLYKDALEIINKLDGNEYLLSATKNNLASLYWRIGLYENSLALNKEIITQENTLDNAITIKNYATTLSSSGNARESLMYADSSLNMVSAILGRNSELYAKFNKEKAIAYLANNDIENYFTTMEESYQIAKDVIEKSNPEFSKYEFQLGRAYYRKNEIAQAEKHINEAFKLRKKYLNDRHPLYAEATKELAELNWFKNEFKASGSYFKETIDNYFAQIDAYFPALSEQEKANFYSNILRPTFEEYNSYVIAYHDKNPQLLEDMYNYQLSTKGLIMYATAKARKNILQSGNQELIDQYKSWIDTKELIAKMYSLKEEEIQEQSLNLDSLLLASDALEKDLSRASAEFAEAYQIKRGDWKEIQAQLKPDEAAIEMIRFKKFSPDSSGQFLDEIYYAALLIDKNSKHPQLILFNNGEELENKFIKNYKNAIKYKVIDTYSYQNYWKSIADKTRKYNKLYFSPDGIYNQISINSLYNNDTKKYVLEEQNIQMLTNTRDLIAYRNPEKSSQLTSNQTPSQLFGFPNYNKGLEVNTSTDGELAKNVASNVSLDRGLRGSLQRYIRGNSLVTSLPGTKEEVEQIEKIYQVNKTESPQIHLSNEADEATLKSVSSPRVLHIATHGFFMENNESNSDNPEDKYAQNPLLKSGLIMAGANSFISSGMDENEGQDGILTAYEAMNLNLSNTELIVLSACETGLGDLKNGEGVYGLRRAFQVAGAEAIIMSLWSVDDIATQELMTAFYGQWLGGKTKQEAFIDAQLSIKQKYKSPYYWGAFVMVGE